MNYMCPPLGRRDLRGYAKSIRKTLGLQNTLKFPVLELFETLPALINDDSLYCGCINDSEWVNPNVHAYYDLGENCVLVRESVYQGAHAGNGRDRMTITHECCHVLLLHHSHLTLTRTFETNIPAYRDPEWHAKCLAGELMVPYDLVRNMTPSEVATACGVSLPAARYQLSVR